MRFCNFGRDEGNFAGQIHSVMGSSMVNGGPGSLWRQERILRRPRHVPRGLLATDRFFDYDSCVA